MGRPREHDDETARALLADEVGTSTWAVYSLFGSKDGLLVALGARAFEMVGSTVKAMPETDDPARDLVDAGVTVLRAFVREHPILFRIGFRRGLVSADLAAQFETARLSALAGLTARVQRLETAGLLGGRDPWDAVSHFNAICDGLAEMELGGNLPEGQEERLWRDALDALVAGPSIPAPAARRP